MRIKKQSEILDPAVRKSIIEEIECGENRRRKKKYFERHMMLKDHTDYFVIDQMQKMFSAATVLEMSYAISNVSITRKVVEKLSKVYSYGANRTLVTGDTSVKQEQPTKNLEKLVKALKINQTQKIVNKYVKLHRNAVCYVKPCPTEDDQYSLVLQPLAPYLYDVIENFYDRTKPMVYILSSYDYMSQSYTSADASKTASLGVNPKPPIGDRKDEKIADTPQDANIDEEKQYIWWSDDYHFTTNSKGEILNYKNDDGIKNPIEVKPFVNYAIDQDNQFWAEGGDDLINNSIQINAMITNINHIGVIQGYGQFWYKGANPPQNLVVGPNKVIVLRHQNAEEPEPSIGFASANPPMADLQSQVEMMVALTLTTNNLSTKGVSTSMSQAADFPSAIAMIIDSAESTEDVKEQQQIFQDAEPVMFNVINKWLTYYAADNSLTEDLVGLNYPEDLELQLIFPQAETIMSESERLDNIQKRKDLGLNTMQDLVKIDQPNLTDDEAKAKLELIQKEKLDRMKQMAKEASVAGLDNGGGAANEGDQVNGQSKQNNFGARPVQ